MIKHNSSRKLITEKVVGSHTIAGTEWPVSHQIWRVQSPYRSRPEWHLITWLCNGTSDGAEVYDTLREARANLDSLVITAI